MRSVPVATVPALREGPGELVGHVGECQHEPCDGVIALREVPRDAGRRHLAHVRQSVLQLEQTIATLLALAREQHVVADAAPITLLPVLERVVVEQAPLLDGREDLVDVVVDVPPATAMS